jgi:hypothetical protein
MRRALAAIAVLLVAACLPSQEASPPPVPASVADLAGEIVYVGYDDELWIARPDGSERRRLTSDGDLGPYRAPRWSPDGRSIAAIRLPPPADLSRFVLIDPESGTMRVLSRIEVGGFSWSRDGERLAVALGDHMHSLIQIVDLPSGEWRGVAPGSSPAWSPVDDRIAFETPDGRIAVAAPDGAVRTLATPEEIAKVTKSAGGIRALYRPTWSRDGTRVGFVAVESGAPADAPQFTIVAAARGGDFHAWPIGATGHLHDFPQPVWSPTRDVFAATDVFHVPHVHHLWLGRPSAAPLRLLDEARPHFLNVAWSPDGGVLLLALDELHAWKFFWVDTGRSVEVSEGGMWPDWCCRTATGP